MIQRGDNGKRECTSAPSTCPTVYKIQSYTEVPWVSRRVYDISWDVQASARIGDGRAGGGCGRKETYWRLNEDPAPQVYVLMLALSYFRSLADRTCISRAYKGTIASGTSTDERENKERLRRHHAQDRNSPNTQNI